MTRYQHLMTQGAPQPDRGSFTTGYGKLLLALHSKLHDHYGAYERAPEEGHRVSVGKATFNLLKLSLREDTVTQNYIPKKTTEIIVDTSPLNRGTHRLNKKR